MPTGFVKIWTAELLASAVLGGIFHSTDLNAMTHAKNLAIMNSVVDPVSPPGPKTKRGATVVAQRVQPGVQTVNRVRVN